MRRSISVPVWLRGAVLLAAALCSAATSAGSPLKVFILAGQSNMAGMGSIATFPAVGMDPKTAPMLEDMLDKDGKPVACENVYISLAPYGEKTKEKHGKLDVSYGGGKGIRIGPEYTFGIYAHKLLGEPILIIKTAWGGKDLINQFRPPSAGPRLFTEAELTAMKKAGTDVEAAKAKRANSGEFYRMMIDHIKKTLEDPKAVYPEYDPAAGYEIAGFVWFQGYNDFIQGGNSGYPLLTEDKGGPCDYSEYTRLLGCFIRDIRKDLNAPKMPFVTGVFGMDGMEASEKIKSFRKAQAATAELPEFKGNVVNVFTEKYWPEEISRLKRLPQDVVDGNVKVEGKAAEILAEYQKFKTVKEKRSEAAMATYKKLTDALYTPEDLKFLDIAVSQQGYHYWGSAKFYAQAGKAFAEAVVDMQAN
jgi:alpha-galactosidase